MRALILVLVSVGLVACSGMENIYHKEGDHFKNWRVKYSPHPFSPSVERDYNETCPARGDDSQKPDLENCVADAKLDGSVGYEMAKEPGFAGGLGGSVLQAGAIAFAGHQIGRGLGKSGSSVTQNGGGATSSSMSSADADAISKSSSMSTSTINIGRMHKPYKD